MSNKLESVTEQNFEVVKEYLNTGSSKAMTPEYQRMVELCVETYGLLKKYPQKHICVNRLMTTYGLSRNTAKKYVDFCRDTWSNYIDLRREFLETWMVQKLVSEISNPNSNEAVRAKNLSTLQKYLDKMPDNQIDPRVVESNTINIQVNMNGRIGSLFLSEQDLEAIPLPIRQKMLAAMSGDIDDDGAVKLLES